MLYPCPYCFQTTTIVKYGFFTRKADRKKIQRFRCKLCRENFSAQTHNLDYRLKKREFNQFLFKLLCKGTSQRASAYLLRTSRSAVARRVVLFGKLAQKNLDHYRQTRPKVEVILFDELVTFEHCKCKPVTVPIAVENVTRKILAVDVGRLSARGKLKDLSIARYGKIPSEQGATLDRFFASMKECAAPGAIFASDKSPHYPQRVAKVFPGSNHLTFKGRRASVVGQGEMKQGRFDPLFYLNHTYAMFRDNLKRLSRKTWCTTKSVTHLSYMLHMYAWFHNKKLDWGRHHFEFTYEGVMAESRFTRSTIAEAS